MKLKAKITGMSCAACSAAVERAVGRLAGVQSVQVNLVAQSMLCKYDEKAVSEKEIFLAVSEAGFGVESDRQTKKEQTAPIAKRFIISLVLLLILMYVSMGNMLSLPMTELNPFSRTFIQFLLSIPIVFINRSFFVSGTKALIRKAPNMNTLISIGSGAGLIYGTALLFLIGNALYTGDIDTAHSLSHDLYFESSCMILTLVTLGNMLSERTKKKSGDALNELIDLAPKTATVLKDGIETEIPVSSIAVGDTVIIKSGGVVPCDGVVLEGSGSFDTSALTGESMPTEVKEGEKLCSAYKNLTGYVKMRAEKVGEDTTLAEIIRLVEDAGSSKAPIAKLADRVSGVFVPVVIALAVITLAVWLILGFDLSFALKRAVSVLVISCPCALGLATPVAITVAAGRGAKKGILFKSAEIIETLGAATAVALDKTGTVTKGVPTVTDIVGKENLISVAASIESLSDHPTAKAICSYEGAQILPCTDFVSVTGKGIEGTVNGKRYYGGSSVYMKELGISVLEYESLSESFSKEGKTVIFFGSKEEGALGAVAVADPLKEDSARAVSDLKALGLSVTMLTGDGEITANAIAQKAGIDKVYARLMPKDKEKIISALQKEGHRVIMAGDGINDAPSLTRADIGVSLIGGTDIAADSSDVMLMKGSLADLVNAITLSRHTLRIIKQNLFWSLFYNCICIPVAAGVLFPLGILLNPAIAAAAMSVSSLFVLTNSLRIRKK